MTIYPSVAARKAASLERQRLRRLERSKPRACKTCGTPTPTPAAPYCPPCLIAVYVSRYEMTRAEEAAKKYGIEFVRPEREPRKKPTSNPGAGIAALKPREKERARLAGLEQRIAVIAQVEALRMAGNHAEAEALHCRNFETPYQPSPTPVKVLTGNRPV